MKNAAPITNDLEQQNGKLEPSEHLENNPGNNFDLIFLLGAPLRCLNGKILKVYFIKQLNLSFNNHLLDMELISFI